MPRATEYTRLNEVRRRLRQSVIRYNNEPVYVNEIEVVGPDVVDDAEIAPPFQRGDVDNLGEMWLPLIDDFDELTEAEEQYARRVMDFEWLLEIQDEDGGRGIEEFNAIVENIRGRMDRRRLGIDRAALGRGRIEDNGQPLNHALTRLELRPIAGGRPSVFCRLNDPGLNINPVKLGMMNTANGVLYLTRAPQRRNSSQGLTNNCLIVRELVPNPQRPRGVDTRQNPDLAATILGQYPTFRGALAELAGNPELRCRAFNRDIALEIDRGLGLSFLWYKTNKIGWSGDGLNWTLGDQYQFLRETLADRGVNVNAG